MPPHSVLSLTFAVTNDALGRNDSRQGASLRAVGITLRAATSSGGDPFATKRVPPGNDRGVPGGKHNWVPSGESHNSVCVVFHRARRRSTILSAWLMTMPIAPRTRTGPKYLAV